ncbi:hypothetical protein [Streptomyces sp. NPDC048187]
MKYTRLRTALEAGRLPDEAAGAFATHLAAAGDEAPSPAADLSGATPT